MEMAEGKSLQELQDLLKARADLAAHYKLEKVEFSSENDIFQTETVRLVVGGRQVEITVEGLAHEFVYLSLPQVAGPDLKATSFNDGARLVTGFEIGELP